MDDYTLLHGDCLEEMAAMDADSVDAVVCDPPYGLEFMGKEWDRLWNDKPHGVDNHLPTDENGASTGLSRWSIARPKYKAGIAAQDWHQAWATEALRVLKPSHYLLAFGGTRTWHRLACAIEDAGFEIRDTLMWLHGQGFPKGKSCLKPAWEPVILARKPGPMRELGIEECRVGTTKDVPASLPKPEQNPTSWSKPVPRPSDSGQNGSIGRWPANLILECTCDETREGTAACGNSPADYTPTGKQGPVPITRNVHTGAHYGDENGKEPVRIHTDPNCPCAMLDGQTGTLKSGVLSPANNVKESSGWSGGSRADRVKGTFGGDSGGASRFFLNTKPDEVSDNDLCLDSVSDNARFRYVAKASRSERNAGCEGMEEHRRSDAIGEFRVRQCRVCGSKSKPRGPNVEWPACGHGDWEWVETDAVGCKGGNATNHHPTVKPLALMRWLVKLVAQPGDVVLDPFMGSGTTGVACAMEGREFIGIEQDAEYLEIARRRIEHASAQGRLPLDESPPLPPVAGRPT